MWRRFCLALVNTQAMSAGFEVGQDVEYHFAGVGAHNGFQAGRVANPIPFFIPRVSLFGTATDTCAHVRQALSVMLYWVGFSSMITLQVQSTAGGNSVVKFYSDGVQLTLPDADLEPRSYKSDSVRHIPCRLHLRGMHVDYGTY